MNGDTAETVSGGDTRVIAVGDLNPDRLHGTRVVLWVMSDKGFDASSLAKQIAAAHGGVASVTLVSVQEVPANTAPHATPIGELCACDPRPMAERAAQPLHQGLLCRLGDAMGERLGDVGGRSAETPTTAGCAAQTPPRSLSAHGAAPIDGDAPACARELALPLTVMVASGRLLEALTARWAGEPDIAMLGAPVTDPACLLMSLRQRLPRLLLLDQRLFDRLGPESARTIAAAVPGMRVLLLCDELGAALAEAVLRNRFHGALLSRCSPDASLKAIRAVSRGEFWLPRSLLAHAVFESLQPPALGDEAAQAADRSLDDARDALTPREAQVVAHLRQGFSNKEIARRLGVMEDTVKKHLQSVFAKLGVHRRALVVLRPSGGPLSLA